MNNMSNIMKQAKAMQDKMQELQKKVAKKLGYSLVDHKMELFGKKIKTN